MRKQFASVVKSFVRDESGASLVEYSVLIGLVTATMVAALVALSGEISTSFTNIKNVLATSNSGVGGGSTTP